MKKQQSVIISSEAIAPMVHWLRHEKIMLDSDLAELYGVPTKVLNQAVKRNADRFPADFMFQITEQEEDGLRCQAGISMAPATEDTLNSDTSRPFDKPTSGRIAVKVINHLGDEVMKVFRV